MWLASWVSHIPARQPRLVLTVLMEGSACPVSWARLPTDLPLLPPCSVGQSKLQQHISESRVQGLGQSNHQQWKNLTVWCGTGHMADASSELDLKGPQGATGRSMFRSGWGEWWQMQRTVHGMRETLGSSESHGVDLRDTDKCGEGVLWLLPKKLQNHIHHTVQVSLALILGPMSQYCF